MQEFVEREAALVHQRTQSTPSKKKKNGSEVNKVSTDWEWTFHLNYVTIFFERVTEILYGRFIAGLVLNAVSCACSCYAFNIIYWPRWPWGSQQVKRASLPSPSTHSTSSAFFPPRSPVRTVTQRICQCTNSSSNICLVSIVEKSSAPFCFGQGSVSDLIPNQTKKKKKTGFSGFTSHRW